MSGLFDWHPKLRIVLGHMGEGLPFWLQRAQDQPLFAGRQRSAPKKLLRLPSE